MLYQAIGAVILAISVSFFFVKVPAIKDALPLHTTNDDVLRGLPATASKRLFQRSHFVWAAVAQFFNVAAQGGTWAYFINYGHEKFGLSDEKASYYFSLSMVMMMAGRFIGTFLMRYIAPNKLLASCALANIIMCVIVAQAWGWSSFVALIMINFFFSIMFPTIFSLGLKDLGRHTQQASSFIVMGVVGGAVFPYVMGLVANRNVAAAYYLPIVCYLIIFLYGYRLYKVVR
jgi:FHS family L-fucose permease-like MFS transporter